MKKVGALTIGQSPRLDTVPEMEPYLAGVEILQAGALDGLSYEEVAALAPEGGGRVLVSRLRDRSWVTLEENKIIPLLQKQVDNLCQQGAELIIMLCTGKFPDVLRASVPIIYPQRLLYGVVPTVAGSGRIGVVNPDQKQLEQCVRDWSTVSSNVTAVAANPYDPDSDWEKVARVLIQEQVDWVVLNCIGYSRRMKELLQTYTGKPVILPRTLLARIVGEVL